MRHVRSIKNEPDEGSTADTRHHRHTHRRFTQAEMRRLKKDGKCTFCGVFRYAPEHHRACKALHRRKRQSQSERKQVN